MVRIFNVPPSSPINAVPSLLPVFRSPKIDSFCSVEPNCVIGWTEKTFWNIRRADNAGEYFASSNIPCINVEKLVSAPLYSLEPSIPYKPNSETCFRIELGISEFDSISDTTGVISFTPKSLITSLIISISSFEDVKLFIMYIHCIIILSK